MIRLIQRRLIVPRGDTGTFSIPMLANKDGGDVSVFTIFNPLKHEKIFEKVMQLSEGTLSLAFSHGDTVNLPVGQYVWDIKFYSDPVFVDEQLVGGTEVDSYYAAFSLPVCEIRETGDSLLMSDDAPQATLAPEQIDLITGAINEANFAKDAAATSEANAANSAEIASTAAESANSAAEMAQQYSEEAIAAKNRAIEAETNASASAAEAAASAAEVLAEMPTKVSDLENDLGFLTEHQDISGKADIADLAAVAMSGSYEDLENKPFIPANTSDLVNDSNFAVDANYIHTDNNYTTAEKDKLSSIAVGAEVNVNADWNAVSGDAQILNKPTNVSAFTNDAGYLTEHQDISGKANSADLATVATSGSYNDLSNKPFIPSAISDLTDDSGHYTKPVGGIPASDLANGVLDVWSGLTYHTSTMSTDSDSFVLGGATDAPTEINKCLVTSTPDANVIPKFDYQGRLHSVTPEDEWDGSNAVATTEYVDNMISDNMPEIPTNVSELNNDAGYLTEHQDISGKENVAFIVNVSKENNTAVSDKTFAEILSAFNNNQEVICIADRMSSFTPPDNNKFIFKMSSYDNHSDTLQAIQFNNIFITQINNNNYFVKSTISFTQDKKISWQDNFNLLPTKTSELTNDSNYLTSFTETDPTVPSWAKAAQKPTYTAAEVGAPTVQEMNTAISTAIGNVHQFDIQIVQALPTENIQEHTIYFVPKTGETNDVYDEYIRVNNAWEMIGNTQIDLSNYATKSEIPTVPVQDVQVNGSSILSSGIADIPVASQSSYGTVKVNQARGIFLHNSGQLSLNYATSPVIKNPTGNLEVLVPYFQHESTFYGLAKAAGDTTQSQSNNAVGTYTAEAKAAIQNMLDVPSTSDIPDIQINSNSIVSNGIANITVDNKFGVNFNSSKKLTIYPAEVSDIDGSSAGAGSLYRPIVPAYQHASVFYGLAKLAGDNSPAKSNVGLEYTDAAKTAILNMFGLQFATDAEIQNIINGGAGA